MSAREIIEQIKSLSPEEKAVVTDYVHSTETSRVDVLEASSANRAKREATAEKIFDRYDDLFRKLAK